MNKIKQIPQFSLWPNTDAERANFLKKLTNIDIVSFDIFDTALLRPWNKPRDLFKYIEFKTDTSDFFKNRRLAEKITREKQKEKGINEVTLDQMYDTLATLDSRLTSNKLNKLKQLELDLEIKQCVANPMVKKLYDFLIKKNVKIVFTSDIYLDKKTIVQMLEKCGYKKYDALYLSSIDLKPKKTGERYTVSFKNPARVLHIGDNEKADIKRGSEADLNVMLCPLKSSPYLSARLAKKLKDNNDLFSSFWRAHITHADMPDYFYAIGYQYTGPLLACFCHWLQAELKKNNIRKTAFLARDGLLIKRVFDILYPNSIKQNDYIYASRALLKNALENDNKTYLDYLNSLNLTDGKIALIDVGRKGSIQLKLTELMHKNNLKPAITGYYVDLRNTMPDMHGFVIGAANFPRIQRKFWDFFDFLLIADQPLTIGLQYEKRGFTPITLPTDADEEHRHDIARRMHAGTVAFAQDILRFGDKDILSINPKILIDTLPVFMKFSKMDKENFRGVFVPFGLKNEKKRYIVTSHLTMKKSLFHPWEAFKLWRKAFIKW